MFNRACLVLILVMISPAVFMTARADQPVDPLPEKGAKPKTEASEEAYWKAWKIFRFGKPADWPQGRALLQQAADEEYVFAQTDLGLCYLHGDYGYSLNPKKAADWFRLAAERGNGFAMVNLSLCYFSGKGVEKSPEKTRQWLKLATAENTDFSKPVPPPSFFDQVSETARRTENETLSGSLPIDPADQSRASAFFLLGAIEAQAGDKVHAQEHFVKAATMGNSGRAGLYPAAVQAAINYALGQGVPRDMEKANSMLERGKKLSQHIGMAYAHGLVEQKMVDDFAQADLEEELATESDKTQTRLQSIFAQAFADPKSKTYDLREAAKWYELAAGSGDVRAMLALAFLQAEGKLGTSDYTKAFEWFKQAAERGNHWLAWSNLSICYQNGIGTARDEAKAAEIFKAQHDQAVVCYLGTIGQCPRSLVSFEQELALSQDWATQKNDPQVQYILGRHYLNGWGVEANPVMAADWFKKAGNAGNASALRELGRIYEIKGGHFGLTPKKGAQAALRYYTLAADHGDAEAMSYLGNLFANGFWLEPHEAGVEVNEQKAVEYYERCLAVDPQNVKSHLGLGIIYQARWRAAVERDAAALAKAKMLQHFTAADKLGSAAAALNLGSLAYDGIDGQKDYQQAYIHFDVAANRGLNVAHRFLGQMNELGQGVPVSYREAAYHYRLAGINGDMIALARLCDFYVTGKEGLSQDLERASFWLVRLFQLGDTNALTTFLDVTIERGHYADALSLLTKLTDASDPKLKAFAFQRLSRMYDKGWGVKVDHDKAQRYGAKALKLGDQDAVYSSALALIRAGKKSEAVPLLQKAAEAGSAPASYSLGCMYFSGDGIAKDGDKGWKLIREAANRGNVEAEFNLAVSTLTHLPGAPAWDEAITFARAAESAGHPKAKAVREKLEALRQKEQKSAPADSVAGPS